MLIASRVIVRNTRNQPCTVRDEYARPSPALASEVADHQREAAEAHEVVLVAPTEPIVVSCDPERIEQALTNLIGNAIKYSPEGGEVVVSIERRSAEVAIEVRDRGVGIPDEERSVLFQPFRRLANVKGIQGIGLGLFVTRGIVEAHGGRIEVDSAPGKGTSFRVLLPVMG